ncbi:MAG: FecR family protein [Verrucomicrobiae bacterium]|nr:FecR family protein [Verrucomicrobiae bacterium]
MNPAPTTRLPAKAQNRGVTLIELIVISFVIACLGTFSFLGVQQLRHASQITQCLSNLRQIHQAMVLYFGTNEAFPLPDETLSLKDLLQPYLTGGTTAVFHCPLDCNSISDSYSYFYAPRGIQSEADSYVLGCNRHQKSSRGVAVFSGSQAESYHAAPIQHNGVAVKPGTEFNYGTMTFADGSQASVSAGAAGNAAASKKEINENSIISTPVISALFSYQRSNGQQCTVIKMKDGTHGTVSFDIVPGHHFEVVTPAAVIAVRGTKFSVTTLQIGGKPATRAEVSSGVVDMEPVAKGRGIRLTANAGENKGLAIRGETPQYE